MAKQLPGFLVVLSGPSGVGKGTVCTALRERMTDLVYSVSATTRKPRAGEREGVNYFFKSKEEFERMIEQDELLEWAQYVNHYYGTPRTFVEETLAGGQDVILEIEVQGALQVRKKFPEGIFIFLLPPTLKELKSRIEHRGTESKEDVLKRLGVAIEELKMIKYYDYAVVNDKIEKACERIQAIITAEHLKTARLMDRFRHYIEGVDIDDYLSRD